MATVGLFCLVPCLAEQMGFVQCQKMPLPYLTWAVKLNQ